MTGGGPGDAAREARRRAELLVSAGRAGEAIVLLERALAAAPDDAATLCQLSLAYLHAGDRKKQLATAERAAAADPESEWAHRLRCDALGALGRRPEAVEAARRALALAPREPLALLCLVNALRATDRDWEEATARAEELVALAPARGSAHEAWALVALGRNRLAEAEAGMRRSLALEPETASFHNNLGLTLLRQGRREEAVAAFENAARIDPTMEVAQRNLSIGIRRHLHRSLPGLLTDGLLRFIPGGDRPELARVRRMAVAIVVVAIAAGVWLGIRYAPNRFPSIFATVVLAAAVVAPRIRQRRLSPTLRRFAASRRLASPNIPLKRVLLMLVTMPFFLGGLVVAILALVDPKRPYGPAHRALVGVVGVVCLVATLRVALRRR